MPCGVGALEDKRKSFLLQVVLQGRTDKFAEQRMGIRRPRFEFGVELAA